MARRFHLFLLAASVLIFGYILFSMRGISVDAAASVSELRPLPIIIIDPGHGGIDGGAVSAGGIVEKDINLAISLTLRDMLTVNGFEAIMTRDTDISIHDDSVKGTRNQKTSDLRNRLAIVNEHPGAIFISIHQNKFGSAKSNGAQMFFGSRNLESEKLAKILQRRFVADLQPGNKRQVKKAGKDLFLMYNAECPSVLIECGFLSNPAEAERLVDPEYQSKVAFTTMSAIFEFLGLDSPGGTGIAGSGNNYSQTA